MRRRAMFSDKLERRRKNQRLAMLFAVTLFVVGIGLIVIAGLRGFDMLAATDADPGAIVLGVLVALAGLFALCLIVYAAIRAFGRVTSG